MKARIALIVAGTLGLAACQADGITPPQVTRAPQMAAQEDLLTLVSNQPLTSRQQQVLRGVRTPTGAAEMHLARISAEPARQLKHGAAVRIAIAPGLSVVATGQRVTERAADDISWAGPMSGEEGWVQLVYMDGGVAATVRRGTDTWRIVPLGDGLHAITRLDPGSLPPEHPDGNYSGALFDFGPVERGLLRGAANSNDPTIGIAATSTINVAVVYTSSAASAAGNIASLIQLAVDETNQSYANSGITINMQRVYTGQVTYTEANRSFSQHVNALVSSTDGVMDNVHTLRNTYAADMVMLVVNDSEACGQAAAIKATASNAFAVAHYSCITGYYSFGHELGHLQGARHDRFVDSSTSPYSYGHGFIPASKAWRTVMAYGNNCSNCTRIQYWSSPLKTYGGVAMGTTTYEDNARVLNTTAATVAAFR